MEIEWHEAKVGESGSIWIDYERENGEPATSATELLVCVWLPQWNRWTLRHHGSKSPVIAGEASDRDTAEIEILAALDDFVRGLNIERPERLVAVRARTMHGETELS